MAVVRDPERIGPMLDLIRTIWVQRPDLRLGQLIANCVVFDEDYDDIYNVEDEDLAARLAVIYPGRVRP